MIIESITSYLESLFPVSFQEAYDNSGLLIGNKAAVCTGMLVCLDVTEEVLAEATDKNCNLVIAHHPLIFKGLKRLNGQGYLERTVIKAVKNDLAVYAIHTNLDNFSNGVNAAIADRLGLRNRSVLQPAKDNLSKLFTFVPMGYEDRLREALFGAGAGKIAAYGECSFNVSGYGTFKAGPGADPFVGNIGEQHREQEVKVEVVFPRHLTAGVTRALRSAHPYEEPAFDIIALENPHPGVGSGLVGELERAMPEPELLQWIKDQFNLQVIRHTALLGKPAKKIALCGGAGSFLLSAALRADADLFISSDIKYHEFFEAEGRMVVADIGHYESEQFTIDLLIDFLRQKFSNFAILKTGINTNPVKYFPG